MRQLQEHESFRTRESYEQRIKEFAHVIRAMARRLACRLPAYLDAEDLISVGTIGLMDAMDKYDAHLGATFKTYATILIRGAMLDEIRSMDWIPRSAYERIGLLQKTRSRLMVRLGRAPQRDEVAAELKMAMGELDDVITRAERPVMLSLEEGHDMIRVLVETRTPDALAALVHARERASIVEAIQSLPERQRLVVWGYYYLELKMKHIGKLLNVTESRICQIHAAAIRRLNAMLAGSNLQAG